MQPQPSTHQQSLPAHNPTQQIIQGSGSLTTSQIDVGNTVTGTNKSITATLITASPSGATLDGTNRLLLTLLPPRLQMKRLRQVATICPGEPRMEAPT